MEKPTKLFVAAKTKGIKELMPREGRHRNGNEGAVIFATPNIALASIFLIEEHNDSWTEIGYFNNIPYVVICMNKNDFIKKDRGGVIYDVPVTTFDFDPLLGMGEKEWTSSVPVKPIKETYFPSTLDTIINNGVYVFFTDKKTLSRIKKSNDHGLEILSSLTSENEKRDKNIESFKEVIL